MKFCYCIFLLLFLQSCDVWLSLNEISDKSIQSNKSFNINDSLMIKVGCISKGNKLKKIYLFQKMISEKPISRRSFKVSQNNNDLPFIMDFAQNRKWKKMTKSDILVGKQFVRLSFRPLTNCSDFITIQEINIYNDTLKLLISPNDVIIIGTFLDVLD
jgi:hypothetical protein